MSILSWLSGAIGAVKPDSHTGRNHRLVAPDATPQKEPVKTHRYMRREQLYLAIRETVFHDLFEEPIGQILLENQRVRLLIFEPQTEEIKQWIPRL